MRRLCHFFLNTCLSIGLQGTSGFVHGRVSRPAPLFSSAPLGTHVAQEKKAPSILESLSRTTSRGTTSFRGMNQEDVTDIVRMFVREYGAMNPQRPFTLFPSFLHRFPLVQFCDNFALACIIYLSLYQRLRRKWITESDHQVWVICSLENDNVLGVAEVSLEAPGRRALPIGLPVGVKKRLFGTNLLQPYISNVIIKENHRGNGFGKVLLRELEQVLQQHGQHQEVALHVNANAIVAQSLYIKLGYTVVESKSTDFFECVLRFMLGLYFLPEEKLLYMKKELTTL